MHFIRPTANKKRFFSRYGPRHVGLGWEGQSIGILTDDDMSFFKSQNPLSLKTERSNIEFFTAGYQSIPERLAMA